MNYIVSKLVTDGDGAAFYLLGQSQDKKNAAEIAAAAYRAYNKVASDQNVAMITEWLATRGEYSFRADKQHRLQLAITPMEDSGCAEKLVYEAKAAEDAKMLRLSRALIDGKNSAVYEPGKGCSVEIKSKEANDE